MQSSVLKVKERIKWPFHKLQVEAGEIACGGPESRRRTFRVPPAADVVTLSFAVVLLPLDKTNWYLREFVEKKKSPVVLFTISQFLHVHPLKQLVPYLHDMNLKVFIGGIPFMYDKSLKREFSDCIFPRNLTELTLLLENSLKGEPR